ncbi:MAG: DUF3108 domain-containing protein [Hyphomicrobiales bacterium]
MRLVRVGLIGLCAGLILLVPEAPRAETASKPVAATRKLKANYDLELAGFRFGDFSLTANFDGPRYDMVAKGEFEILAGLLFRGDGTTRSAGTLTDAGPKPSMFEVSYKGGDKKEKRQMRFADGAVTQFSIVPAKSKKKQNPNKVPLNEEQLVDVLDPLTAAFLSIRSNLPPGDPELCRRSTRVFDGQQVFDIILSPKRTDKLLDGAPSAIPQSVAVCRVKYIPVSGYRSDNPGVQFMRETDEVEVWLASVTDEGLYLPYRIVVPTPLGSGSATLTKVSTKSAQ